MFVKNSLFAFVFVLLLSASVVQAAGDPVRGSELQQECSDCHGEDGMGLGDYPRIAGLKEDYLFEQLKAFKNGERPNRAPMMLWFLEDLSDQDMADLAAYYASLDSE